MHADVRIRHLAEGDWSGIIALEAAAYAAIGLSEDEATLRSRAQVSPSTCTVLDQGGHVVGYCLALPYPPFSAPDLSHPEHAPKTAAPSPNLHLHDLVIAPALRGRGLARRLLRHLTATARATGYEQFSLVSVAGSQAFWTAHGYRPHPEIAVPHGYGTDAVYMTAPVPAGRSETDKPPPTPLAGPPLKDDVN
ncbi:GNAT family N-acetyltransferase [Streptomyces zagrosensis]|uniref:Ribosomal protein S18 acetylase RimI-like enzyme n=1 Tax=Streptomyces zagrosensis TaxID=1042984 RepID=A0A7W9V287_9ACTN|nr:GNAT family N-acetyltransferase [Streptomyces zagrosensis]MBB5940068.1 ribosomal protein S18 acetylase RimI-like enzyme [Streptomyces zagrosensis]